MKPKNWSLLISRWLIYAFMAGLVLADIAGWRFCRWLASMDATPASPVGHLWLFGCLVTCSALGYGILFLLDRLLGNLTAGKVFIPQNARLVGRISLCCFLMAVPCVVCALLFWTLWFAALVLSFAGLILRTVANVFDQAVRMKQELDLTV